MLRGVNNNIIILSNSEIKKGMFIMLEKVCRVKVVYEDENLMQVEYDDMSRKLLKKDSYLKTKC
tara:strand:- start:237 stop:428 length:192 start_codon:yes stop_codon:yes gene_type:complete